jgi:hypothetical protein
VPGLKLLEDGSLVKDFEAQEAEHALQTIVQSVSSVDKRYTVSRWMPSSLL